MQQSKCRAVPVSPPKSARIFALQVETASSCGPQNPSCGELHSWSPCRGLPMHACATLWGAVTVSACNQASTFEHSTQVCTVGLSRVSTKSTPCDLSEHRSMLASNRCDRAGSQGDNGQDTRWPSGIGDQGGRASNSSRDGPVSGSAAPVLLCALHKASHRSCLTGRSRPVGRNWV